MNFAYGRISLFGNIGPAQTWSTGWSFAQQSAPSSSVLSAILTNQLAAAVADAWEGANGKVGFGSLNNPDTTLVGLRAYYYPANAHVAAAQGEFAYGTAHVGKNNASLPTQTALVASTLSGLPGRSNRGRMYLPATGASLAGHQVAGPIVADIATSIATMLGIFNAMTGDAGTSRAAIASKNGLVPITSVRVDSEPDIQRRRADKIHALSVGNAPVSGA